MASSTGSSPGPGSDIRQFIRTVLNAVNNLQPRGGQSNETCSSTQQFSSVRHEIRSRFRMPRGREGNANFSNPRRNYSCIPPARRPVQGVENRQRRVNFRPLPTALEQVVTVVFQLHCSSLQHNRLRGQLLERIKIPFRFFIGDSLDVTL